jgi:acylphosphatase
MNLTDPREQQGTRITVTGNVQGVGFRIYTQRFAAETGITGSVRNLPGKVQTDKNRVEIEAYGNTEQLAKLIDWLKTGPKSENIAEFKTEEIPTDPAQNEFIIKY